MAPAAAPPVPGLISIPLTPVVAEALKAAGKAGMTLSEIRRVLLGLGIMLDASELSSCLSKLKGQRKIDRTRVVRAAGLGPRKIWRYTWVSPT